MKTSTLMLYILFGLLLTTSHVQAQTKQTKINDFIGTWEYTSQDAPYAYRQGQFMIAKNDDGEPSVKVIFSNGESVPAENITIEGRQLRFDIYVESGYVTVILERDGNKLTGTADTPNGEIALTADRG